MRLSAAIPAAIGVAHGATAIHGPVVEWAGQSTIHPTGDPRGPTYGSEGGGARVLPSAPVQSGYLAVTWLVTEPLCGLPNQATVLLQVEVFTYALPPRAVVAAHHSAGDADHH